MDIRLSGRRWEDTLSKHELLAESELPFSLYRTGLECGRFFVADTEDFVADAL